MSNGKLFLLSPARCTGERAKLLFDSGSEFDLARRVRAEGGAPLGEIFAFLSGLYFRGKLAYSTRFSSPPRGTNGSFIITSARGLVSPETHFNLDDLRAMGEVPIDSRDLRYREPLERDARRLGDASPLCDVILLGSIADGKYVDVLLEIFGARLHFPLDFVGRGDMSRGGLMLRCVESGEELRYAPVSGAARHGERPAKLSRRQSNPGR